MPTSTQSAAWRLSDLESAVRAGHKRVGAADAATCFIDRTPAPSPESSLPVARRDRGAGRPTKRDRRILDRFRTGRL